MLLLARLIVVSNRVAVPGHGGQSQAGGLAVAIRPVLRRHPGIWFGWSGQVAAAPDVKVHTIQHGRQTYVLIDLALQLPFLTISESMGNHDSEIVDAGSVD